MTHLLDTNSCVEHLRRRSASRIAARLAATIPGEIVLCSIVVAELLYGAYRSAQRARNLTQVQHFRSQFLSLPFDDAAAEAYGDIRAQLDAAGTPIGPNDLMIASIARVHGLTLVTHNTAEFSRAPGLAIEDWQIP